MSGSLSFTCVLPWQAVYVRVLELIYAAMTSGTTITKRWAIPEQIITFLATDLSETYTTRIRRSSTSKDVVDRCRRHNLAVSSHSTAIARRGDSWDQDLDVLR
ncbi:hypothetical protein MRB53_041368 [Persea americana]|nr:hypothetical protein MRB53_041368 [Persea americana]